MALEEVCDVEMQERAIINSRQTKGLNSDMENVRFTKEMLP
jgi:hypothetical protein